MGRQELGERKVISVRCRGGNVKSRALRLNEGNFNWISEKIARKCKILEVLYNTTNNEHVRTQTIVKNTILAIDSTPFEYFWHFH